MTAPKLCECGCGRPTKLAQKTDRRWGKVKGRPLRFIPGHNLRCIVNVRTDAAPAKVGPDVRRCRRCPYPLVPVHATGLAGWRRHAGRGLCEPCHKRVLTTGELIDFERFTRSRDELLDEWVVLRAEGYTMRQAAERLGMTHAGFQRAYHRARRAGDPRALPALAVAS
jgi:transposase-like protein